MKQLLTILPKRSGRDAGGRISVRHQGGRQKRFLREVDFKRDKNDIWGKVIGIEYDPNRNANVALVSYDDGEKRYILAPLGLKEGMKVISSPTAPHEVGNTLPLGKIPTGAQIHNIEILPGKEGLVHISQLADYRVEDINKEVSVGQKFKVRVTEIDHQGRINLTRKFVK